MRSGCLTLKAYSTHSINCNYLKLSYNSLRFSSFKKRHPHHHPQYFNRRRWNYRINLEYKNNNPIKLPTFDEQNNRFMLLTHPDQLLAFGGEYSDINSNSWTVLNNILTSINLRQSNRLNNIPPIGIYKMEFYLRPKSLKETPKKILFNLRLSGGRCPDLMKVQFEALYRRIGLKPYKFEWGKYYWRTTKEISDFEKDMEARKEDEKVAKKEIEYDERDKKSLNPLRRFKWWKSKNKKY